MSWGGARDVLFHSMGEGGMRYDTISFGFLLLNHSHESRQSRTCFGFDSTRLFDQHHISTSIFDSTRPVHNSGLRLPFMVGYRQCLLYFHLGILIEPPRSYWAAWSFKMRAPRARVNM